MVAPAILGGILTTVGQIADDLFTSDEERGQLALEARRLDLEEQKLAQQSDVQQVAVNVEEAKSANLFVSGWRPAVGWLCVAACGWNWLGLPVAKVLAELTGHAITLAPANVEEMMPVLLGMLGLGGLRTIEKVKQVAAK